MTKILLTTFILLIAIPAYAYENDLDGLLADHVKQTTKNGIKYNGIDYSAWKKDKRHKTVLNKILATKPSLFKNKDEKLAYWINAYNVLTIDLIIRHDETESIKNLGSWLKSPWKKHSWTIDQQSYTLDNIEHDIIRPMNEPRIHFAINCAAKSCPDLRKEAYRAHKLNEQLDEQTRLTFENKTKGFKKQNNTIHISKVIDWFKEDFNDGNVKSWLISYFPKKINKETKIKYFKYDWSLNKQ